MLNTEQMIAKMADQGLRITDQRRMLVQLFVESERYLSPKDVYIFMGKQYAGLSFNTVYRNLRMMCNLGVLEQVEFENGIKFRVTCENGHHHHMICLQCEKTYPIYFCPIASTDIPNKFQVVQHKFEIFGYCETCTDQEC